MTPKGSHLLDCNPPLRPTTKPCPETSGGLWVSGLMWTSIHTKFQQKWKFAPPGTPPPLPLEPNHLSTTIKAFDVPYFTCVDLAKLGELLVWWGCLCLVPHASQADIKECKHTTQHRMHTPPAPTKPPGQYTNTLVQHTSDTNMHHTSHDHAKCNFLTTTSPLVTPPHLTIGPSAIVIDIFENFEIAQNCGKFLIFLRCHFFMLNW